MQQIRNKLSDFGESKYNKGTLANTSIKGTIFYMSPELINIMTGLNNKSIGEFNPEKCDIFSLEFTFLRLINNLKE